MRSRCHVAFLLTMLMVSSGCMGLFGSEESENQEIDCQEQPNDPSCFVDQITAEDCTLGQVFTGELCRQMTSPSELSYGEISFTFVKGVEIQTLTPSFIGDGPDNWLITPALPSGLNLNTESGEISGQPDEIYHDTTHTVVASNFVGSTSYSFQISVISEPIQSVTYELNEFTCNKGQSCEINAPSVLGGIVESWIIDPLLQSGLSLQNDGSIIGYPTSVGHQNYTITAYNEGGSYDTILHLIVIHPPPMGMSYGGNRFDLTIGEEFQTIPTTSGGEIISWSIVPPLPDGLDLIQMDGSIRGAPTTPQSLTLYRISATNTGGTIDVDVLISVSDLSPENLRYSPNQFQLLVGESIEEIIPSYDGGLVDTWYIEPPLPSSFVFDYQTGSILGTAQEVQNWVTYTIFANNTGGSVSTDFSIKITSSPPDLISWPANEFALRSNESALIVATNDGPIIDSWTIYPALPGGLTLLSNGTIEGTPIHGSDWTEYTITAVNTGGSVSLKLWIAVHDTRADQHDLLRGIGETNWNGYPSLILPIGEWAFPVGLDSDGLPVVSASHVGRGKMIGYGHEGWIDSTNSDFPLRAVEWVCGENAEVGLAFAAGFDDFEDELRAEGHNVHFSVTPDDLSNLDCLLDEFWNGHDDSDNEALLDFMNEGGGLIMAGHSWYWSYSNSDVAHNYPGNKIAKTTGLFVSNDYGGNDVYFQNVPDNYSTLRNAIQAVLEDRVDGISMNHDDAAIAYSAISSCTSVVTLDYTKFWAPLRDLVNQTGYTVIPYSTLWSSIGYDLGEDPVADIILRLEDGLMNGLPANELPVHPSHVEFPGEVPSNASRISRNITVNGTQPGLPSEFGYANARSAIRMSSGLYAPPGEVVTVTVDQNVSELGISILIGAHTDQLWKKDILKRHSRIHRSWLIDNITTDVANAFGGPIYVKIPAGSEFGNISLTISGAIDAPMFVLGETSDFEWIYSERDHPAPWAELVSNNFIMTVPSHEIREITSPTQLMEWWDLALSMEHELYGFEPWPRVERAVFDVQISAGWMHSGYPFMAHDLSVSDVVNFTYVSENGDWGMFHELGHNHQWMPSTLPGTTETGCNFASVYLMEELVGTEGHGQTNPVQRASRMRTYFDDGSNIDNWSVWTALDTYLIIKEEWGWSPITEALSVYYDLPQEYVPETDEEKFNSWVYYLSNATGYNLAPYHIAWGFPISNDVSMALQHLPVWVDDPLRGEYFVYDAILRNIHDFNTTENSTNIKWETYDNGTNTTLTLFWSLYDMGNQSLLWSNSEDLGAAVVGWDDYELSSLSSNTTYYGRIKASHEQGDVWFGPFNWTTSGN